MDKILKEIEALTKKVHHYLSPSEALLEKWKENVRVLYDFIKAEEYSTTFPQSEDVSSNLIIENCDAEMVYQQVEFHNEYLLSIKNDVSEVDDTSLCFKIAQLAEKLKAEQKEENDLSADEGVEIDENEISKDTGMFIDSEEEESGLDDSDNDEQVLKSDLDDSDNDEQEKSDMDDNDEQEEISDDNEQKKKSGLDQADNDEAEGSSEDNEELSDEEDDDEAEINRLINVYGEHNETQESGPDEEEIDFDADTFGDIDIGDGEQDSDEDDGFEEREDEFDMDKEMKTAMYEDDDKEGEGRTATYSDLFNAPEFDEEDINEEKTLEEDDEEDISDKDDEKKQKMIDDMSEVDDEGSVAAKDSFNKNNIEGIASKFDEYSGEESDYQDDEQDITEGGTFQTEEDNKVKTPYELSLDREQRDINILEKENIGQKAWYLTGEVSKSSRPMDSALEEYLEVNTWAKQKPEVTEEINIFVERIILERVRNKAYDSVERVANATIGPHVFKQRTELNQEKNTKSLTELYSEEYMKTQEKELAASAPSTDILTGKVIENEENPLYQEIKNLFSRLFPKLDALCNCHYTPKMNNPEIKIVSNLSAINIEEATPITETDATLLAPQEIVAPLRSELKGQSEKTSTDRKRERRYKKIHQKKRAKAKEENLKNQLKKASKDNVVSHDASVKMVEKALKKGQIKLLEPKSDKAGENFFTKLQNNIDAQGKKRKIGDGDILEEKKKKKTKLNSVMTAKKLLL